MTLRALYDFYQRSVQSQHNQSDSRVEAEGSSGVKAASRFWKIRERTAAHNKFVATAMPYQPLDRRGEDLGKVGERHRTLTRRVEDCEQEDEEGSKTNVNETRDRDKQNLEAKRVRPSGESEQ